MLKDLLARFKKVFTVAEWKQEAQDAMARKEFVVASLNELHRVEKAEALAGQDRVMSRQQGSPVYGAQQHQPPIGARRTHFGGVDYDKQNEKRKAELSLADLMNSIRQQQEAE
jgi:hypothetical protein